MSIDLKTTNIEPIRRTFDHLAEKLGPDKNPTRYQEATFGLQPQVNQHYRPTWDSEHLIYDTRRTAIVMQDFDDLADPRQYYYGTWTIQRGKQQDSQEKNFSFVESKNLLGGLDEKTRETLSTLIVPLRHVAWGANTNNSYIAAYGFGAPITSAASMHMMDHLGIAQYITRIGLILGDNEPAALDVAKQAWMDDPMWQPLRALVEEVMVTKDWFEVFIVQNLLIDGVLHPLVFDRFDTVVVKQGGAAYSMMTEFMVEWFAESSRWVDAILKVAAAESVDNTEQINKWMNTWAPKVREAVRPLAVYAFGDDAEASMDSVFEDLGKRIKKAGLTL